MLPLSSFLSESKGYSLGANGISDLLSSTEASVSAPPKTPSPPSSHFNAWYFPTSSHLSTQYSGLAVPSSQLSSSSGASW